MLGHGLSPYADQGKGAEGSGPYYRQAAALISKLKPADRAAAEATVKRWAGQ
ncbi:hypothetical protein [Streptomyces atratus]|uniref:hypothetical protein n=1 Tax=Streptomyces atratus TaxID=1893 RepID=UPI0033C67B04